MNEHFPQAPVLALHGSASTGAQWASLATALDGQRQVIAPDLPGYGQTAEADRKGYFRHVVDGIDGPFDIVAHSYGAAIAVYLANAHAGSVRSVTLYDPMVPFPQGEKAGYLPPDLAALWSRVKTMDADGMMHRFIDYWCGSGRWDRLDPARRSKLIAQGGRVRRDFEEADSGYWVPDAVRYAGPLRVWHGALSPSAIRQSIDAMDAVYPQMQAISVPGLGHMAPLTHRTQIDALFCAALTTATDAYLAA